MQQGLSADDYGHHLQELIHELRAKTGVHVPFATVTMRLENGSSPHWQSQRHGAEAINAAMHAAAKKLPSIHVVDGTSVRTLPRYFDGLQHCLSPDLKTCLGPNLYDSFHEACSARSCSTGPAPAALGGGPSSCMSADLHFTATGQIAVGEALAETFIT